MPDQSSAATEHALMQEITAPLARLPDDPMALVADFDFPIVLRGYDRLAVEAYIKKTSQLVAELQATRSPDAAVRRALERVGEQVSGILQRAHDTAAQITTQSRREAEDRLEVARTEAAEIKLAAEQRVKELDVDTDRIWGERHRIVDDARELASQLLALAESAAERFPAAEDTGEQPLAGAPAHPGVESAAELFDTEAESEGYGAQSDEPGSERHEPGSERVEPEGERVEPEGERVEPEGERYDPEATAVLPRPPKPDPPPEYPD